MQRQAISVSLLCSNYKESNVREGLPLHLQQTGQLPKLCEPIRGLRELLLGAAPLMPHRISSVRLPCVSDPNATHQGHS
eukprot:m.147895 g.147895  ORF g.147895 m.147895 type:complete len:79 (+) comp14197_c0_seq1:1510-1746(+)